MLLSMFAVFFQFQWATMIFGTTTGNETLFTRGSVQMSWMAAREACDNVSNAMLSDMRSDRALGLLHIGELAWIDGKEFSFCYAKNNNETSEMCKYVTVMREDIRNNHTYICNMGTHYESRDDILSYTDAANTCLKSSASLQVVETFVLPLIVPGNRTYWIKGYNATSIINRLSANEHVTEICIGIVKLGHDIFKFGTASCDATHTVICDASGVPTALTLTIRDVMMPRLGDLKASNQSQADDLIVIVLYSTLWVIPFSISIIAIVKFRKKRLIKGTANNSVYSSEHLAQLVLESTGDKCGEDLDRNIYFTCHVQNIQLAKSVR